MSCLVATVILAILAFIFGPDFNCKQMGDSRGLFQFLAEVTILLSKNCGAGVKKLNFGIAAATYLINTDAMCLV